MEYGLESIFPLQQLALYYNIMHVLIAPQALIIQIPMSSKYIFNHYRFLPFPTHNLNETLVLEVNKTDLLLSQNKKLFTEANPSDFVSCQTSSALMICPSNILPLFNSLDKNTCLMELLAQNSMPTECMFRQEKSPTKIEILPPKVFLTRNSDRPGLLTCPDGTRMVINRTIAFREECSFEDPNIKIL